VSVCLAHHAPEPPADVYFHLGVLVLQDKWVLEQNIVLRTLVHVLGQALVDEQPEIVREPAVVELFRRRVLVQDRAHYLELVLALFVRVLACGELYESQAQAPYVGPDVVDGIGAVSVFVDENVGGLDVAVNDVVDLFEVVERCQSLLARLGKFWLEAQAKLKLCSFEFLTQLIQIEFRNKLIFF